MASVNLVYLSLILLLPLLLLFLYQIVRPRPVKIPIKNRQVFITGGSSGIGLVLMAFLEVSVIGIIRVAALCFQWNWYSSIEKWHAQKKRT